MSQNSYISASAFPIKLLLNNIMKDNKIKPYHIQLYPTNLCNLSCEFCSCANRNKKDILDYEYIKKILTTSKLLGCEAVTISGGGEPTLHPNINKIIKYINFLDISIGMTTNGKSISNVDPIILNNLTWCRISHSDDREWNKKYISSISDYIVDCPDVDWSFSYVVTKNLDLNMLSELVHFSNEYGLTHVRLVSDLLDLDNIESMDKIKEHLKLEGINDSIVIYQGRKEYTKGTQKCLISLLKPVINADGNIYPCCGVQYALEEPSRDCNTIMSMGKADSLFDIYNNQEFFDGTICDRCYYNEYNILLNQLTEDVKHKEFL